MEVVTLDGAVLGHIDGRTIECAWFVMHEGRLRGDQRLIAHGAKNHRLGVAHGWDTEHGGRAEEMSGSLRIDGIPPMPPD